MERDVQQKMTGRHGAESEKIDTKKGIEADGITTRGSHKGNRSTCLHRWKSVCEVVEKGDSKVVKSQKVVYSKGTVATSKISMV